MTTLTPTSQDLRERLVDAEQELQDAKRAAGAAVLDGTDERAAAERVSAARSTAEGLRRALGELGIRAAKREAAEHQRQEAIARWRWNAWHAEYIKRVEPVLRLRAELHEAEGRVMALGNAEAMAGRGGGGFERWLSGEITAGRLEPINLPHLAISDGGRFIHQSAPRPCAQVGLLTMEACAEWAEQLAPLVEQAAKEIGADAKPENLPWSEAA